MATSRHGRVGGSTRRVHTTSARFVSAVEVPIGLSRGGSVPVPRCGRTARPRGCPTPAASGHGRTRDLRRMTGCTMETWYSPRCVRWTTRLWPIIFAVGVGAARGRNAGCLPGRPTEPLIRRPRISTVHWRLHGGARRLGGARRTARRRESARLALTHSCRPRPGSRASRARRCRSRGRGRGGWRTGAPGRRGAATVALGLASWPVGQSTAAVRIS